MAASPTCETRWAVGTSSAKSVPLGAFAEWLQPDVTETVQLVRGVIHSLTSVSRMDNEVVLCVDDVHQLDDLSAFVVQQLVQRNAAKVVLTLRDGDLVPGSVREIWHGADFERLELQPFSRDETSTLLSTTLGGPMDSDAVEHLWRLTRGNVLYLHHIVEQGLSNGRIVHEERHWRWKGEPVVPVDLIELIESRMGALPGSVAEVIDVLAIAEPLELDSLQTITAPAAVEHADTLGLVTLASVDGRVEVRLAHPLYGEVRRNRAPPTRMRRLRALVATELASSSRCDEMRVIVHRAALTLESDLEPDPELLLVAAQGAVWLADLPLADRLSEAAIRAGGGMEAYLARAHALSWLGRGREADEVLEGIPADGLTDCGRSRVAFLRSANILCAMADPTRAKRVIEEASRGVSPDAQGCIDAFRTVHLAAMGMPDAALKTSKDVELKRLPAVVGAVTAWAMTLAYGDIGRTTDALSVGETGYTIARGAFDAAQMRFVLADAYVGALLLSGRIGDAVEATEALVRQSADLPGAARLLSTALAGRTELGAGRLKTSCDVLEPVVDAFFASGDTNGFGYQYHLVRTTALAMRGATVEAAAALETLARRRYPSWRYLDYAYCIARAWVAACEGALSEASEVTLTAARTAREESQFAPEVMCLQTATQFGDASGAARLQELAALVEGPRAGAAARFAAALRDGDGDALVAVADQYEEMGDRVAAVDAAAHAAITFHRQGLRGSALGCASRAEALAQQCGGARTPALRRAVEPLPLTDREREIVMLLGGGLSSRAVADRLFLSVRTVESHIYKAMAKTGTGSRNELAALLSQIPKQTS
jgi:DNA-binding CsgD family transcriptional regulator